MTSSLVGSEMCIRDSTTTTTTTTTTTAATPLPRVLPLPRPRGPRRLPVSYTHLTLPTSVDLGGR
eukprot:12135735-Prorocentrum_lima.AAC.1